MTNLPQDVNNGDWGAWEGCLGTLCFLLKFSLNLKLLYKQSLLIKRQKKWVIEAQRDMGEP